MVKNLMDSFVVAILAVVLIPIVDALAISANVTGTARTIVLLLTTFIALGVLFSILKNFTKVAKG